MEQQKITPRFFFITLGILIALITSVVSLLNVFFGVLDATFPDVLSSSYTVGYSSYAYDGLRGAISTLIIFFPIYLVLERYWAKLSGNTLSKWDSILRKWSLYLILFLASITILIDLVVLVRYFVGGEITIRFILKVFATLLVAGLVGFYYLRALQGVKEKKIASIIFVASSIAIVLAGIVWGFLVIGGPVSQRALKLDERRRNDLRNIQSDVVSYWQQTETLPKKLSDLSMLYSGHRVPTDPEFEKGFVYEYNILSEEELRFEVCAVFAAPTPKGWVSNRYNSSGFFTTDVAMVEPAFVGQSDDWQHETGRHCFERTINPTFTPPFKKDVIR